MQSSDAADRFGVTGESPNYLKYYFSEDDSENVLNELKEIENTIGKGNIKLIEEFMSLPGGYNEESLEKAGLLETWKKHKKDYADYILGKKILEQLMEEGECSFTAEL